MKQCSKCKKSLELVFFYKKVGNRDNVTSWCKDCDNKRHRLWRKNHPEEVKQMSRLQRIRHPEKMRAAVRKYGREHPEVRRKAVKKWVENNWNKTSAHKKVYYAVKVGKIVKKSFCEWKWCRKRNLHAHHENYNEPLKVIWLCAIHHKAQHVKL